MAKPPKKRALSLFDLLNARTPADVLPAGRREAPFNPNVLRATPPGTIPERRPPGFWERQRAIQGALPEIAFQIPQQILKDIAGAKTPDQIVAALTGLQLEPGKRSPMNALALAALLGPEFAGARRLEVAERAIAAAERNATRYSARSTSALAHLDPLSVPAFERAGASVSSFRPLETGTTFLRMHNLPARARPLVSKIERAYAGGGFTFDRAGEPFAGSGFAIVNPKLTQELTSPDPGEIAKFLARPDVEAALERPGAHIGGWRDPATGRTEINITDIVDDRQRAISLARQRQQKAYGEFEKGFELSSGRAVSREEARDVGRAQTPNLAPEYTQLHSSDLLPQGERHAPLPPNLLMTSAKGRALHDALLADEAARITRKNVPAFEAAAQTLPSPETFGAGAIAGAPKLGWYANSARALSESFGPEAPRFAALLSALSPQQPVGKNLAMALDTWEAWAAQGRPQDPKIIERIMHDVARRNPGGGQMGSRIPNALAALTVEDPATLALSGPKVFSFHRNLIGEAQRVTLDTWMSQLANVKPTSLSRTVRGVGVPSPTYLAYSGRVRQTAAALSKATGRTWTPAEVQETLWSWGKALSETAEPLTRKMAGVIPTSMRDVIPSLSRASIEGVPDFASLLRGEPYSPTLGRLGLPTPGPSAAVEIPRLPAPNLSALDELAKNMERSQRGIFGNERGAIGSGKVYRVETPTCLGPHCSNDVMPDRFQAPTNRRPTHIKDKELGQHFNLRDIRDYVFGFESPDALRNWFGEPAMRRALAKGHSSGEPFGVSVYNAPRFFYSPKQAAFDLTEAERISHTPFEEWLKQNPRTPRARYTPQTDLFDNRAIIPTMLGAVGGAGLGGLTLAEYLQGRR